MQELAIYLSERRQLHGKVWTTDELEIAGAFVKHGTLSLFINADADGIIPGPELANIFDEIWEETRGGPLAVFDPPGPLILTDLRASLKDRQPPVAIEVGWY